MTPKAASTARSKSPTSSAPGKTKAILEETKTTIDHAVDALKARLRCGE